MKKNALCVALLTVFGMTVLPAMANDARRVTVETAPPPPYAEESMPAPREGYVWAPGYWSYSGTKHVWSKGHFVRAREGYRYVSPHWVQEENRWTLYPEQWVKNEDDKEKTASKDSSMPAIPERR
jgi:hypothetical protein